MYEENDISSSQRNTEHSLYPGFNFIHSRCQRWHLLEAAADAVEIKNANACRTGNKKKSPIHQDLRVLKWDILEAWSGPVLARCDCQSIDHWFATARWGGRLHTHYPFCSLSLRLNSTDVTVKIEQSDRNMVSEIYVRSRLFRCLQFLKSQK